MDDFRNSTSWGCASIDANNVPLGDAAAVAQACADLGSGFDNALEVARLKLKVGTECYPNGNAGPMGNSNFGHQKNWCSVHRAAEKCVEKANKLGCDLSDAMSQHLLPSGCSNVLACPNP